ncbi:MAG: hypothetical protein K1X92_09385 [Bacteroidia bacterium]|nr:hypothetical protein [Bacteroidia bacterium]
MAKKIKKRFLDSIGAALRENVVEEIVIERKMLPKRKLGFLDHIGADELDAVALGEVMPLRETTKKKIPSKTLPQGLKEHPSLDIAPLKRVMKTIDYNTELYTELLEKVRDVAHYRKLSINDIFNQAIKDYTDKYWDISMMGDE